MNILAGSIENDKLTIILFFAFLLLAIIIYSIFAKKRPSPEKMWPEERALKMIEMEESEKESAAKEAKATETKEEVAPKEEQETAPEPEVKEELAAAVKEEKVAEKAEVVSQNETNEDQFAAIKYSYSYLARVSLAPKASRERYLTLKREILSYANINNTISWREERFTLSGKTIIKFKLIGNVLRMYIGLTTDELSEVNIKIEDVSKYKEHEITPSLLRISGKTGVKRGLQAIEILMNKLGLEKDLNYTPSEDDIDPVQDNDELLAAGLIRKI